MATSPGTLVGALYRNPAGMTVLSIETILLTLDFVSLGLRLWSRRLIKSKLRANDILIIVAVVWDPVSSSPVFNNCSSNADLPRSLRRCDMLLK